jgi:hypothetical protein
VGRSSPVASPFFPEILLGAIDFWTKTRRFGRFPQIAGARAGRPFFLVNNSPAITFVGWVNSYQQVWIQQIVA